MPQPFMAKDPSKEGADRSISESAFERVLALRNHIDDAAKRMAGGDSYPDFFVEGGGPPWHEYFPDVITPKAMSEQRMTYVDMLPRADPYPDFFVEGGGPPWHEYFPDVVHGERFDREQLSGVRARVKALERLRVFQAYQRMKETQKPT